MIRIRKLPRLKVEQIREQYPDQWVLLDEPTRNARGDLRSARVLWHGESLEALQRAMPRFKDKTRHSADFYTGVFESDLEYAL